MFISFGMLPSQQFRAFRLVMAGKDQQYVRGCVSVWSHERFTRNHWPVRKPKSVIVKDFIYPYPYPGHPLGDSISFDAFSCGILLLF